MHSSIGFYLLTVHASTSVGGSDALTPFIYREKHGDSKTSLLANVCSKD